MRKNELITYVDIDEAGTMVRAAKVINPEIAPLQSRFAIDGIRDWWKDRAAPITQGRMKAFLEKQGLKSTGEYLTANLGLSLTDYYWIKPEDSDLTWEQVNFFDNDFKEDIYFASATGNSKKEVPRYSPNGSLIGDIEKTWAIVRGRRCVIKGNRTQLSGESINEVIATKIHEMQGYDNYVSYRLIKIKNAKYDYGCISESFVTQEMEFVPAWAIHTSEKKPNHISNFEHFLNVCEKHGINKERLQSDLEYQIMTDFILSGYDRHYNNFGVLRDADTLQFIRMAPIFDSGGSLFSGERIPKTTKELLHIKTHGIADSEKTLLRYVRNKNIINLNRLPPGTYIKSMYEKDSQVSPESISLIVNAYEKKIELCDMIQRGKDPWKR